MPDQFLSPDGDLERMFVDDYAMIDQFAATGSLWTCGYNGYGQLGTNDTVNRSSPVQTVAGGTNWRQAASGQNHTAAIKTDGTLWTWGVNLDGRLGTNDTVNKSSPVQTITGGDNWKQVACGAFHVAAIKNDGAVWTWGDNSRGQLGDNTIVNKSSPVQTIAGGTNWKQVACGSMHTAAIKTDGTLWTWGDNQYGRLGDNTTVNKSSPVQTISGGTNWKSVTGGYNFTAAIKTDGTLWTWGDNAYGQLGDNSIIRKSSPVQTIASGTNWKQVACGSYHTVAIKTDGTLWTWGFNVSGQLGNNGNGNSLSPIQTIAGGTNWKSVTGGYNFTAAIKTDGTLWTWGENAFGQLSTNDTFEQSSPVQTIAGGTNWKSVGSSSSSSHVAAIHFYDAGNLYPNA